MAIRRWARWIGFVAAILACAGAAQAVSMYSLTPLPTSGGAGSINNNGLIAYGDAVWQNGIETVMGFSYEDFTYPGGHTVTGQAQGINDAGQVVVQQSFWYWDDGSTDTRSYIWQDGVATELTSATGGDAKVYALSLIHI